jgi:Icc-related predicted phosphoesterase
MQNHRKIALLVPLLVGLGCQKTAEAPPAKETPKAPPPAAPVAPKSTDAACITAYGVDGEKSTVTVGPRTFERTGAKLTETSADPDDQATFGVLANIKEDTPENLANIQKALAFFKESQADAILVVGDVGESESQIANALTPIAETGLPVFVIIGNREKKGDFNTAVASVAAKFPGVINLGQVRLVSLDDVALVSLPGYHDKAYLHAEDGCQYLPADVDATKAVIQAAAPKTVVMVSHGPPKQEGSESLDRTLEQANVGDAALAALLRDSGVKFGVFANIQEAGGRATDLTGTKLVSPDKASPELFLNPGAIDAVSWKMNDQTRSIGMAAVLSIKGKEGTFKTFRIPGGED